MERIRELHFARRAPLTGAGPVVPRDSATACSTICNVNQHITSPAESKQTQTDIAAYTTFSLRRNRYATRRKTRTTTSNRRVIRFTGGAPGAEQATVGW